jgi:hypothetical protein
VEPRLQWEFEQQILTQCRFFNRAYAELEKVIRELGELAQGRAQLPFDYAERAFYAIQNLLNAAANISKAMWGSGRDKERVTRERKLLRDRLGVTNSSPLFAVTMRNNFEHFDERLDEWWKKSKRHNSVDMNIGPKRDFVAGFDEVDLFRNFNFATGELTFWSETFDIPQIANEVARIGNLLEPST